MFSNSKILTSHNFLGILLVRVKSIKMPKYARRSRSRSRQRDKKVKENETPGENRTNLSSLNR